MIEEVRGGGGGGGGGGSYVALYPGPFSCGYREKEGLVSTVCASSAREL